MPIKRHKGGYKVVNTKTKKLRQSSPTYLEVEEAYDQEEGEEAVGSNQNKTEEAGEAWEK